MNLQDMMMKLSAYSVGCQITNGNLIITIKYDDGWKVIPPENDKIEFARQEGVTYYAAAINEVPFDDVFKSIKETIDYNIDLQRKVMLFKSKVSELQELFASESLERLKTITFVFDEKKKPKRKYVRKAKKVEEETVTKEDANEEAKEEDSSRNDVENASDEAIETIDDGIEYHDYEGEDVIDDGEENKVDYMEQLRQ